MDVRICCTYKRDYWRNWICDVYPNYGGDEPKYGAKRVVNNSLNESP